MRAAREPAAARESARLLVINANTGSVADLNVAALPGLLEPGDLFVVNDAATIPASLRAGAVEVRLARDLGGGRWQAVLFGEGDWRIPTELRDLPPVMPVGARFEFAEEFAAEIDEVSDLSSRLVTLRFNRSGADFWSALYAYGRPIQYSYHLHDLPLWSVQTAYAARPWSVEMPSAGRPLTWGILLGLRRRGVKIAWLTHGAGLSATGDDAIDEKLPFAENYDIPQLTVDAIEDSRRYGRRILAAGTTVVRAIEGSLRDNGGSLRAGAGETNLVIGKSFRPEIVSGILTGVHDPAQSHFRILQTFAGENTLRRAWRHAEEVGYLCHEFGDLCLILGDERGGNPALWNHLPGNQAEDEPGCSAGRGADCGSALSACQGADEGAHAGRTGHPQSFALPRTSAANPKCHHLNRIIHSHCS